MPIDLQLEGLWGGYTRHAVRDGEKLTPLMEDFTSSEDGDAFFRRLEYGPDVILKMLPNGLWINRGQIDHLLIVFGRNQKATVYLDELSPTMQIRSRGKIAAGQGIARNQIADIESYDVGVPIGDEAGLMFLFSVGWRKGFYFDFTPLHGPPRSIDLKRLFGQFYARLLFQNIFNIPDAEWEKILAEKWFPFIGLSNETRTEMVEYVRANWSIDELTSRIVKEVKAKAPEFLEDWEKHPTYSDHVPILRRAVERFLADDFISCTGLLFPRIEGLMRANHIASGSTDGFGQKSLSASAIGTKLTREASVLLPQRFHQYLESVYFGAFGPRDANIDCSRHSVGHGVASADRFDEKSAVIGVLVTHQLLFFFERANIPSS